MYRSHVEAIDSRWPSLYGLGGVAALLALVVGVVEIVLTFLPGGNPTGIVTAVDWYGFFQSTWFFGLRNLGLLNIFLTSLGVLILFALYGAHRQVNQLYAALALAVSLMGAAVFFATNRAFPMLDLSREYAAAATEGQRLQLAAAGEALLAVGQSHTPGTFLAFALSEIGTIGMALVMLRGKVFSPAAAYFGLVGFGLLLIYEVCASFIPAAKAVAMIIAILGGLSSMVWYLLVARRLFQLGRKE